MAQRITTLWGSILTKPSYWGGGSWRPRKYRTTLRLPESQLTSQPDLGVIANLYRAHHAFTGMYDWYNSRLNTTTYIDGNGMECEAQRYLEIILESDRKPDET